MRNRKEQEIEKQISQLGLNKSARQAVEQYAKGMRDGMRMAYLAVAKKLLGEQWEDTAVRELLSAFLDEKTLDELMAEAENP